LHLGLRITRFEESACNRIGEARFVAIEQLRVEAAKHQVQFVLIVGDVFDQGKLISACPIIGRLLIPPSVQTYDSPRNRPGTSITEEKYGHSPH